jgi:hypothetical protein
MNEVVIALNFWIGAAETILIIYAIVDWGNLKW